MKKCQNARIMQKCYLENGKGYQFNFNLWWSGATKGFKRAIKINLRVARVLRLATLKKCQKMPKWPIMP